VEKVAARAAETGAAIAAVPSVATVKEVDAKGVIVRTPARERLWLAQTPQGFRRDLILEAHRRARADGFVGTDDAQLVERLGHGVVVVEDSPENLKITNPEDLPLAETVLKRQQAADPRLRRTH
jgi:2-C-methyl-D-erythritol 4-phosphate cytidylyltransferase